MKNLHKLINSFRNNSFKKLADFNDQTNVEQNNNLKENKIKDLLQQMLRKNISIENIKKWIQINPMLNDLNFHTFSFNMFTDSLQNKNNNPEVISTHKDLQSEILEPIETKFLKGIDQVPNLFYFLTREYDKQVNIEVLDFPKEYSNYFFMYQTLNSLWGEKNGVIDKFDQEGGYLKYTKEVVDFIKNNKQKLDSILKVSSYLPKFIGNGVDAIVFDIGQNMVLKIFKSENLYADLLKRFEELHTTPEVSRTEVMIYDVGSFTDGIYYVITEKLVPVNNLSYTILDYISLVNQFAAKHLKENKDEWSEWVKVFDNKKSSKEDKIKVIKDLKNYSKYLANSISLEIENEYKFMKIVEGFNEFKEQQKLPENWLEVYIEEILYKLITRRGDLHLGNVGLTNKGLFKYFDSFHKNWTEDLNISTWK